jgi:hypothetical protein
MFKRGRSNVRSKSCAYPAWGLLKQTRDCPFWGLKFENMENEISGSLKTRN